MVASKKTWFTSDHHFGHKKIINYVNRPFLSVEEMDEKLIENWNSVVAPLDDVYHLGDFSLSDFEFVFPLFFKLNGRIKLVPGGHDKWLKGYRKYKVDLGKKLEILPQLTQVMVSHTNIVLCHYPMLSWDASHYGSLMLHGHTHATIAVAGFSGDKQLPPKSSGGGRGVRIDVGVDAQNYIPVEFSEVLEIYEKCK